MATSLLTLMPGLPQTPAPQARASRGHEAMLGVGDPDELARTTGKPVEIPWLRTETETVHANPDGTRSSAISLGPVRLFRDGGWVDVDSTLRRDESGVRPVATEAAMRFSAGGKGPAAALTVGKTRVSTGWGTDLPTPRLSGSTATYPDVLPDIDMTLRASARGFDQSFVVRARPTNPLTLRIPVQTEGLTLTETQGGELQLTNAAGAVALSGPAPTMWDAKAELPDPAKVHRVEMDIVATSARNSELVLRPDMAFLQDPATVFPVTVDPYLGLGPSDTFVQNNIPTSNRASATSLNIGRNTSGIIARTLVQFGLGAAQGKPVRSARLELPQRSATCSSSVLLARRITTTWSLTGVTWNTMPPADSTLLSQYNGGCPETMASWDISEFARSWSTGGYANNGLTLHASNESDTNSFRQYVAGEGGPPYPTVHIEWTNPPGGAELLMVSPCDVKCTGQEINGVFDPAFTNGGADMRLYARASDPDGDALKYFYDVERYDPNTGVGQAVTSGWSGTVAPGTNATWQPPFVLWEGTYRYRIRADDGVLLGPLSGWYHFIIDRTAPSAPLELESTTHPSPDQWYPRNDFHAWWDEVEENFRGYSVIADTNPSTSAPYSVNSGDSEYRTTAPNGVRYLHVRVADMAGNWGPQSNLEWRSDSEAPAAPTVTSSTHPIQGLAYAGSTFAATLSSSTPASGIDGYLYAIDGASATVPSQANGSFTTKSLDLPDQVDGIRWLHVQACSNSDMCSATTHYQFVIEGKAGLPTPKPESRTQRYLPLQVNAPSGTVAASFQWRRGKTAAFTDVTTADLTTSTGGTVTSPVPVESATRNTPLLAWDTLAAATRAGDDKDGLVQVRACFWTNTTIAAPDRGCTGGTSVTLARTAFGASYAVEDLGPGRVSLTTGDFAVDATDVKLGELTVARSHTSQAAARAATPPQPSPGVLGPGWVADLPGPDDAGAAGYALSDSSAAGFVTLTAADGEAQVYARATDGTYVGQGDAADGSKLAYDPTAGIWALTEADGTITRWSKVNNKWVVSSVQQPTTIASDGTTTFSYDATGRVSRVVAPAPPGVTCATAGTVNHGCRALEFYYAASTTATGTTAGTWGDHVGRLSSIRFTAYDPAVNVTRSVPVAAYSYDSLGLLRATWDPRVTPILATHYTYDGNNRLSSVRPPGLNEWALSYDTSGRVANASRLLPDSTTATDAVAYDIPINGAGAPIQLAATDAARWGQTADVPRSGAAMFPATHVPSRDATSGAYTPTADQLTWGDLTYLNYNGRATNTASYGAGAWQYDATQYDTHGNATWQLSAGNRAEVLKTTSSVLPPEVTALTDSSLRGQRMATTSIYTDTGNLISRTGPARRVVLAADTPTAALSTVRIKTSHDYDQNKPNSAVYNLVTTTTSQPVALDGVGPAGTNGDKTITITGYAPVVAGDTPGWLLRQPTSTATIMDERVGGPPAAPSITRLTRYDPAGRVLESRQPADQTGAGTGTTVAVYYTALANAAVPACGGKPAYHGLLCQSGPKAQPAGKPLPITAALTYDILGQPTKTTETSGGVVRTSTTTYEFDGARIKTVDVAVTGLTTEAVPATTTTYSNTTGLPLTVTRGTSTVTKTYDTVGRLIKYRDGDSITKTVTFDADGRPLTEFDNRATNTYTYDGTDSLGRTERRGLVTKKHADLRTTPSVFTASYNADGAQISQTYPNGLKADTTFDTVGEATALTYTKSGQTWSTFTAQPNTRGQTVASTSPRSVQRNWYDPLGRLTTVQDTVNSQCATRTYALDANSNRQALTAYPAASGGSCATTTTPTTTGATFDTADRITTPSYTYDELGRTLTVPAGDVTNGAALNLNYYYADDAAWKITTGNTYKRITRDALGRPRSVYTYTNGALTDWILHHYGDDSDTPTWIGRTTDSGTTWDWTRNVTGIDGKLAALNNSSGSTVLQLANLHGDTVATADNSTTATATTAYFEQTEYGIPRTTNTTNPVRYGWLGAQQRSSDALGLMFMGVRLYNPAAGRFLTTDPVAGGNDNDYSYPADPINMFDLDGRMSGAGPGRAGEAGGGYRGGSQSGSGSAKAPRAPKVPKPDRPSKRGKNTGKVYDSMEEAVRAAKKFAAKHSKTRRFRGTHGSDPNHVHVDRVNPNQIDKIRMRVQQRNITVSRERVLNTHHFEWSSKP